MISVMLSSITKNKKIIPPRKIPAGTINDHSGSIVGLKLAAIKPEKNQTNDRNQKLFFSFELVL